MRFRYLPFYTLVFTLSFSFALVSCAPASDPQGETSSPLDETDPRQPGAGTELLRLPDLKAVELAGEPLKVVASTAIIGDVVARVGGEGITLTALMTPGQDPHSFEPSARELTDAARAHVIFVNGWDLEEGLVADLEEIAGEAPLIPISAGIQPLSFREGGGGHEEEGLAAESDHEAGEEGHDHQHSGADPHVWLSVRNVMEWTRNIEDVLRELDPANAETYAANAAAYLADLEELEDYAESRLTELPQEKRFLVTNHESLAYFAHDYGFTVLGTVIPGASTLAEPSARDLADLIAKMEKHTICTLFTETTVSDTLAQTVAAELDGCERVQVLPLYTGTLGPSGSDADSYIGMFRHNVDTIVNGLTGD